MTFGAAVEARASLAGWAYLLAIALTHYYAGYRVLDLDPPSGV